MAADLFVQCPSCAHHVAVPKGAVATTEDPDAPNPVLAGAKPSDLLENHNELIARHSELETEHGKLWERFHNLEQELRDAVELIPGKRVVTGEALETERRQDRSDDALAAADGTLGDDAATPNPDPGGGVTGDLGRTVSSSGPL
jgi:hypothetical protein